MQTVVEALDLKEGAQVTIVQPQQETCTADTAGQSVAVGSSILAPGSAELVRRLGEQPIIEAGAVPGYGPIFNAGAIHHDGRFHLFARGVHDGYISNPGPGARFLNYISDVLVFVSDDGRSYEFQQVLAKASDDGVWCYEDPRVQVVRSGGEDQWVMSYTNLPAPEAKQVWRIGMHKLDYASGASACTRRTAANIAVVIGPPLEFSPRTQKAPENLRGFIAGPAHVGRCTRAIRK